MPKTTDSINTDLENLLDTKGYDVVSLDSSGKEVPVPEEAEVFQFHFIKDGQDFGTVTISIDGLQKLTVYYDDEIANSGSALNEEAGNTSWLALVKQLKKFAHSHQLSFQLKDTDRLRKDMKRKRHTKINEGYYGNKKISYSDDIPTVKMIIKHNRALGENDQRFRNIERIFLETSNGERFAVETTKPSRARMFARHLVEGGQYKDDRWNHLKEICEDLDALGGFVRATRRREQFNEGAQRMISEAADQYLALRETAKSLQTSKGYNRYFESYEPRAINEADVSELANVFHRNSLDSRIERAIPTLNKFNITMGKLQESNMFEEWANDLVDEAINPVNPRQVAQLIDLLGEPIPVGPNAINALGELDGIIDDDQLYARLRKVAKSDPENDAAPVILSWMQEQDDPVYRKVVDELGKDAEPEAQPEPAPAPKQEPEQEKPAEEPAAEPAAEPTPEPDEEESELPSLEESDELIALKRLLGK